MLYKGEMLFFKANQLNREPMLIWTVLWALVRDWYSSG